jgi:hypothetical protein
VEGEADGGKGKGDAGAQPDGDASAKPDSTGSWATGTTVRDRNFEFTVTGVKTGVATVGDDASYMQTAAGEFVIVSLTVRNTSKELNVFFSNAQWLYDGQGRRFDGDYAASFVLDFDHGGSPEIQPGASIQTQVVFDLPKGAVPAKIELHNFASSKGAQAALR